MMLKSACFNFLKIPHSSKHCTTGVLYHCIQKWELFLIVSGGGVRSTSTERELSIKHVIASFGFLNDINVLKMFFHIFYRILSRKIFFFFFF